MQTCHGLRDKFLCRKELGDVLLSGCSVGQACMLTFFRATAMLGRRARPVVGLYIRSYPLSTKGKLSGY